MRKCVKIGFQCDKGILPGTSTGTSWYEAQAKRHDFRERPKQRMRGQQLLLCAIKYPVFTGSNQVTARASKPLTKYACRRLSVFGSNVCTALCVTDGIIPTREKLARKSRGASMLASRVRITVGRNGM
jgi:hypothetical protein